MKRKLIKMVFVLLFCTFTVLYATQPLVLEELNRPESIIVDGDVAFILDDVEVKVFSLKDGHLLRKFGKKGEGPGEILPIPEIGNHMELYDNQIIISAFSKMVYFSKEGKHLKDKVFGFIAPQIRHIGDKFGLISFGRSTEGKQIYKVVLYGSSLEKEIKTIYQRERESPMKKGEVRIPPMLISIITTKDKILVFDPGKDFHIDVFDKTGTLLKTIDIPYEKVKLTTQHKKQFFEWYKTSRNIRDFQFDIKELAVFPDYFPAVKSISVDGDTIYAQTYKEKDGKVEFYLLDFSGNVMKKVFVPVDVSERLVFFGKTRFTFNNKRCYWLRENTEEEVWELNVTEVK